MKGIGLVLAGGGGKGAYQIGVWKYLHEYGLDQYVRAVSGTSVGALNAALFASGDFQRAEELWLQIEPQQILSPRKFSFKEIAASMSQMAPCLNPIAGTLNIPASVMSIPANAFISAFSTMLGRRYAFSRDGLIDLINQGINFSMLQSSPFPCYATCLSVSEHSVRRFDLRQYSAEEIRTLLLASSAIPLVFDCVKFQGGLYYDGGIPLVGDNVPIQPVYDTGVEYILVVHLSQEAPVDRSLYPNAKLIEIIPQVDLGGAMKGTLDFTASGAQWRMEQGYQDAQKIFGTLIQQAVLLRKSELLWQGYLRSEQEYRASIHDLQKQKEELQRQRDTDGFDNMCKDFGVN